MNLLVKLGETGLAKQIHLGVRETDMSIDYIAGFMSLARQKDSHFDDLECHS